MSKSKTGTSPLQAGTDEAAQAARERDLRALIERTEKKQSGDLPPEKESAHDFIERKMREKLKK
jgi:hypothetical protein